MTVTKEMIEAFYKAHDAALELQPRENHQAIYAGLEAALSSRSAEAGKPVVGVLVWLKPLTSPENGSTSAETN